MKVPRKALMKVLVRRVMFWYRLVGSSRLGTAGSISDIKSITEIVEQNSCHKFAGLDPD